MKHFVCIALIIVFVFSMATITLAEGVTSPEQNNTDIDNNTTNAPQTSDTNTVYYVVVALFAAIIAVFFSYKKLALYKG